jgi:hypothetical protein
MMDKIDRGHMRLDNNRIRPIIIFGYVLIGLSIAGVLFFYWVSLRVELEPSHIYFILISAFLYVITGLGVIKLTRWGYYMFKIFLYLLLICFPIGTLISHKTLKYMSRNNLKAYFFRDGE